MTLPKGRISGEELDQLGRLGELKFEELCRLAGMQCMRLEPDRVGTDFIVQLPYSEQDELLPFDRRPERVQILVQVKTILRPRKSATASLSSLDHLAKDPRPAVIAIFTARTGNIIEDVFLVHLLGNPLEQILRRQRMEAFKGKSRINNATTSFPTRISERVGLDATALYVRLAALTPAGVADYATKKRREIDELGVPPEGRTRLKIHFEGVEIEQFVDALLGRSSVVAAKVEQFDVRFGLPLPVASPLPPDLGPWSFTFEPAPAESGTLTLTSSEGHTAQFPADIFVAPLPQLPSTYQKTLIRTEWLEFEFTLEGWRVLPLPGYQGKVAASLRGLIGTLQVLRLLTTENTIIEFAGAASAQTFRHTTAEGLQFNNAKPGPLGRLLEMAQEVALEAGYEDVIAPADTFIEQQRQIRTIHDLLFGERRRLRLSYDAGGADAEIASGAKAVFCSTFKLGNETIGFALALLRESLEEERTLWAGSTGRFLAIEPIAEPFDENFRKFRRRVARAADASVALWQRCEFFGADEIGIETGFDARPDLLPKP